MIIIKSQLNTTDIDYQFFKLCRSHLVIEEYASEVIEEYASEVDAIMADCLGIPYEKFYEINNCS